MALRRGRGAVVVVVAVFAAVACTSGGRGPIPTPDDTASSRAPSASTTSVAPSSMPPAAAANTPVTPATPAGAAPPAPGPGLPDARYTPGALNPEVTQGDITQTICARGWTSTVRPPESYTEEVKRLEAGAGGVVAYEGVTYAVHGFALADPTLGHYELDHLVPLELGGAPADPANLWMEPYEPPQGDATPGTGSQTKDAVENAARRAVCADRMSLADAQSAVRRDWRALGRELGVLG